ncbi:ABC transporter atnG [Beauveria bassiana]|nr:ABC transporter atnG [Beauveria bassiana]
MDDSFGPRLLGHFDFTLLFEHTMLHIIPASVIVFATPFYIYTLFHGTNVVRSGVLLWIKIFCALAMVGIQIANAVLWSQSALESQLAQAAAIMTSISAACMGIMVVVGHLYFLRPPSFLGLALTLTMIFDVGTTWTYFHRNGLESIARLHVPLPALKLVLICLEEVSKRNLIRSKALRSSLGQEALAGFWNRSLLLWVNPLLLFGFRREITMNVLPGVGPHLEAELLYQHFQRRWDETNKVSRWALIKACVLTMPWPFLYIILPRLLAVGFNFAQPFLLQDVVNAVASDTESPIGLIRGLILATTAIYVGKAVSKSWYIHLKNQIMIGVRGILISAIYHKSLKLPADDLAEAAAVTLMNVDVTGVTHLISLSYESWARLLEMGLGIGILAVFVGAATLFTIIPTVITSIGSAYVARHMIATRRKWNEHMQDRIAATSNILVQIKDIKMLGLNTVLSNRLQKQFESEIDVSMTNRHQIAATFGIGDFATAMTPVLVIAGTIFWTRASEPISVARFFTTLAVVTLVSSPLSAFVQTLSSWSSGFACLVRIQNYLNLSETEDARCFALQAGVVDTDDLLPGAVSQASSNLRNRQRLTTSVVPYPVEITRVSVCTDLSGSILNDVSMHVPLGGITMVYGPVGCGKSTLLRTILGEVPTRCGTVTLASLSIAYCAQVPWIQNTTIQNNIMAGRSYNALLYRQVLHICALDVDIARLPARDQTICGSDGCNLSGGQKQRISLARTLYTQAELLVLDDPFSSLDRETSSTMRIRLFSESHYLADNASTIVMTTSMRQHLVDADAIYKLDDTGQVEIRSLEQIQTESESYSDIQSRQMGGQSTSQAELAAATAVPTEKEFEPPQVIPTASSGARDNLSNKKYGDFTLYKYFLRPAGLYCVILWLSSIAIAAVAEKMPRIYVRFWLADNPDNRLYYIGYAGLGLIAPVLSYLQAYAFFYFINIKSATSLHWALLDATNRATFEFLTEQDAGELLNRFSQDTSMATQELPMAIMPTIWGFVSLLIDVSIISSGATYATPIIPLFLFILFVLQHFYLRTSRQLRILELDSTKTLVSHSTESSTGIEHIRAFQMEEDFVRHLYRILDESQKPLYFLFAIQQWLISVMDFVTATAAVCIVSLALNFKKTTSASAMGLALLGLISFSDFTSQTVRFFVEMENTFGAVARIRDFARMTPKEEDEEKCEDVPDQWPLSGRVDLDCVSAMYKADTEKPHVALENITVTIQPGQTVGLVGRTGSGKTSLMLALLHLLEYTGSIHIDGRELRTIPRNLLRNRITTITQSGVEFGASVRFNMDPLEFSSRPGNFPTDDTLAGILRRVGLWDHVLRHGGLGAEMRAMKFSVGQKQLFQLARAMLHRQITRSKLVLIDEGTASMDEDTEGRMFHLMREAFAGCTKIIISHREAVLADADLVLSLDDGRGEVYRPQ